MDVIAINDVAPRDGLQSQKEVLSIQERVQLITMILETGIRRIEVGSFVSPKAVPAMAHTDEVLKPFLHNALYPPTQYDFSALIPNTKGYQAAVAAGATSINFVICSTETMNQKNVRKSTSELLAMLQEVCELAKKDAVLVNAYLATCWDCPFEGIVAERNALELAHQIHVTGINRLIISDSIGSADPKRVASVITQLKKEIAVEKIGCHFHDTRSFAIANVYASLEAGVRWFDSSIGGLGGCPFAPGASGNIATEDLYLLASQQGLHTGIDDKKLINAIDEIMNSFSCTISGGKTYTWQKARISKNSG